MASFGFLRGNHDFTILWTGQTVSALGSAMSTLVFPLIGYALTGSSVQAGLATTALLLGGTVVQLPAGALVDRWPRGRTLLLANLFALLCYLSLAGAELAGWLTLTQLIVVGFFSGVSEAFIGPASSAAVRTVVPPADRPAAFAQNQIRTHTAGLIGPPLGGALYSVARSLPFLVDAFSYGVAAIAVSRLRTPLPAVREQRRNLRTEMIDGLRFVWNHRANRAILLWGGAVNFAMTFVFVAITLRLIRIGTSPVAIGSIDTVAAVAGLAGAVVAPAIVARVRTGVMTILTGSVLALMVLPMAFTTNVLLIGGLLAVGTFLVPANNSGIGAYLATITPEVLQGRVNAAAGLIAEGVVPAAPIVAGALLGGLGGRPVMFVATALVALSLAPLLLSSEILRLGRPADWAEAAAVS